MFIVTHSDSTAPPPDVALAQRAARDRGAFAELYRQYLPTVYRYLLAQVGDVDEAEELTAQTFEGALRSIATFDGRSSLSTWLIAIARRKAADQFRRHRRRPTVSLDETGEVADDGPSLDEQAIRGLQLEQVATILRSLSADRAEALALRLFAGLSAAEAATVMGKSEGAVKMLVHRAIQDVRTRLAPREASR